MGREVASNNRSRGRKESPRVFGKVERSWKLSRDVDGPGQCELGLVVRSRYRRRGLSRAVRISESAIWLTIPHPEEI